jgi:hypothetical protein
MFGVLFGEGNGNSSLGVLLFQSEYKAKEALTSMMEKSNVFNNKLFQSWNLKLCAIFNSVDIEDVPEIEVEQIQENVFEYMDFEGNVNKVQLINTQQIACI